MDQTLYFMADDKAPEFRYLSFHTDMKISAVEMRNPSFDEIVAAKCSAALRRINERIDKEQNFI